MGECLLQFLQSQWLWDSPSLRFSASRAGRRALQSIRPRCSRHRRSRRGTSARNSLPVQSFWPVEVPRLSVPHSRSAVGHSLGSAVFPRRAAPATVKRPVHPLFGFRVPPASCPTCPSRPAAANQLLSWAFVPFSTRGIGGPHAAGFACPLRSALRVWLPSRRFTPSEPLPAFFHAGGALGIHPSELPPSGRYPPRFRGEGPTYRFSRRYSRRRSGEPAQRAAVPGLRPFRESLATGRRISTPTAGCSLGLRPSKVLQRRPGPGFRPDSSHALLRTPSLTARRRRRPGVSISPRPVPPTPPGKPGSTDGTTLVGFWHRDAPDRSSQSPSGLCVHLAPCRASLPTTDAPWMANLALPEPLGTVLRCRAFAPDWSGTRFLSVQTPALLMRRPGGLTEPNCAPAK
jgi:hypothetical protein